MSAPPAIRSSIDISTTVMSAAPRSESRARRVFVFFPIAFGSVVDKVCVAQRNVRDELHARRGLVAGRAGRADRGQLHAEGDDYELRGRLRRDLGRAARRRDVAVALRVVYAVGVVAYDERVDAVGEDGRPRARVHVEAVDVAAPAARIEDVLHVLVAVGDRAA